MANVSTGPRDRQVCIYLQIHSEQNENIRINLELTRVSDNIKMQPSITQLAKLPEPTNGKFRTILADPPWRFRNQTGKVAPEHRRLSRYSTLSLAEIAALPVHEVASETSHLYLWVPNALLPEGIEIMGAWGFKYKSNIVWHKIRIDGGSDGRGVGFYFRNVTEVLLFGTRGKSARTLAPARRQVNYIASRKREHSRKPDEQYELIEACSPPDYLELFARGARTGWVAWGNQANPNYSPTWATYRHNSKTPNAPPVAA
jgi:N6-adenosine-specific RNA methylase IME4